LAKSATGVERATDAVIPAAAAYVTSSVLVFVQHGRVGDQGTDRSAVLGSSPHRRRFKRLG
jgi:hypothetical protein